MRIGKKTKTLSFLKNEDLIISPFFVFYCCSFFFVSSRIHGNQNVSMRILLFLLINDPILIKGKMKPSSYEYLARIAYMHSILEEQICKGK